MYIVPAYVTDPVGAIYHLPEKSAPGAGEGPTLSLVTLREGPGLHPAAACWRRCGPGGWSRADGTWCSTAGREPPRRRRLARTIASIGVTCLSAAVVHTLEGAWTSRMTSCISPGPLYDACSLAHPASSSGIFSRIGTIAGVESLQKKPSGSIGKSTLMSRPGYRTRARPTARAIAILFALHPSL
jgi:hypothetical protein